MRPWSLRTASGLSTTPVWCAIHRTAGPELADAGAEVAPCPTGEVRLTPGFRLRARWVLHAVGPVWRGGQQGEDRLLAACYRGALLADPFCYEAFEATVGAHVLSAEEERALLAKLRLDPEETPIDIGGAADGVAFRLPQEPQRGAPAYRPPERAPTSSRPRAGRFL